VFDLCRNKMKKRVPNKGGPDEEESKETTFKKSSKFFIFRCAADGTAEGTSALSEYILKEGKMQVAQTGVFTTLNDILLRRSNANAECTLGRT
jgi:hypothetical protein